MVLFWNTKLNASYPPAAGIPVLVMENGTSSANDEPWLIKIVDGVVVILTSPVGEEGDRVIELPMVTAPFELFSHHHPV